MGIVTLRRRLLSLMDIFQFLEMFRDRLLISESRAEGPAKSLKERGGHGGLVMFDVTDSREDPAMTQIEAKPAIASLNELFSKSPDGLQ
jgi:hypothetical protein